MASRNTTSDGSVKKSDGHIAEQASMATNMAYMRAKTISQTVVVSKNGYIVAESSDGSEVKLGESKRRRVQAGVAVNLRAKMSMNASS
jgi:hypothetical protein